MLRWIVTAVGLVSTMHCVGTTCAQQQAEPKVDIATFKDTILALLADGGLGPDNPRTRFNRSILETHARYYEAILAKHRLQLAEWEVQYEKTMSRILETESPENAASIPLSVETVELLLRECLLELQRIEWEAAALPAMETSKRADSAIQLQMIQLQKAEQAINSIRQKLDVARKAFMSSEVQFKQGLLSEAELQQQQLRMNAIESDLSQKEFDLQSIAEQIKLSQSSELEQTAERSTVLERRRDVVRKQIEQLKTARIRARKAEMLLKQLDRQRAASDSIEQEIARQQLQITEIRTLLKMLEETKEPLSETKP